MVTRQEDLQELDDFHENLKALMKPTRAAVDSLEVASSDDVIGNLLGTSPTERAEGKGGSHSHLGDLLQAKADRWASQGARAAKPCTISYRAGRLPKLRLVWSDAVAKDAFTVALKNAVEASIVAEEGNAEVGVRIEAVPRDLDGERGAWFVDIVLENPGGPISEKRLSVLNATEPSFVDRDSSKPASTGAGVFLARFQLRQVIGHGSDLVLANLAGGCVQCRIRLPAQAVREGALPSLPTPAAVHVPASGYVLYVEDQPSHYEATLRVLPGLLQQWGLAVEHFRSAAPALELAKQKLPVAMLTDLYILGDEDDGRPGSKRNGLALIEGFVAIASAEPDPPPIWVLTQEEESAALEGLATGALGAYHLADAIAGSPADLTAPGSLSVHTGMKRPDQIDETLLCALLSGPGGAKTREDSVLCAGSRRRTDASPTHAIEVPLNAVDATADLRDAWLQLQDDEQAVLIVKTRRRSIKEFTKDLVLWFRHEGLPDPDSLSEASADLFPLWQHVRHSRVVLSAVIGAKLFSRFPPALLYLGLQKNVWFSPSQVDPSELAAEWGSLRQEDRGPLSVLRHDVLNEWTSPDCKPLLSRALDLITQCEGLLAYSEKQRRALQETLASGDPSQASDLLLGRLLEAEATAKAREEVKSVLMELWKPLMEISNRMPEAGDAAARHRRTLQILSTYLGS
ncbi:MAG: hypothetical protein HN341_05020 [Verrucomicrobia bacterium]|nr:hypothetical protein [Verrucomicrobiota bacterium]